MSGKRIICFGEALIDFHAQTPVTEDAPPAYLPHAGGAPANVAVSLAKLGDNVAFIGMLGRDAFGDFLLRNLQIYGVDTSYVRRTDAANTALAFVSLDARGERSFTFYRPPAADLLFRGEHFDPAAFADAGVFHVCSNSLTDAEIAATTLNGMRRARAEGAIVSFDMNLRLALWTSGEDPSARLWSALSAADVVKLSAEEFAFLADRENGEQAVRERLWRGRTRWLIVTDGAGPIGLFTPGDAGALPSITVPAVDSTGAGDAFVGGLLHGLNSADVSAGTLHELTDDPDRRKTVLHFAAACGAMAVSRIGSFTAMPDREEVERFLHRRHQPVSSTRADDASQ